MKKESVNIHFVTKDNFFGYGMATSNLLESFGLIDSIETTQVRPSGRGRPLSKDFFIKQPPFGASGSKKKIAYFYWETDKLPKPWATHINSADEIWAPCNLVRDVCLNAGFRGIIKMVPTPHKDWDINTSGTINDNRINNSTFKFYSIFQWHTRKGWQELLEAYWSEFKRDDDVVLILKVNSIHGPSGNDEIKKEIDEYRKKLGLINTPKIFFISSMLSQEHICALHEYGDCYVAPHHGEGWGMPIHDAIFAQKNIITTKYGGVTDFLNESNSSIIEHTMGEVKDMTWNSAYEKGQNWAYPSVSHLKYLMRDVFDNRDDKKFKIQQTLLRNISRETSIAAVSNIIKKSL